MTAAHLKPLILLLLTGSALLLGQAFWVAGQASGIVVVVVPLLIWALWLARDGQWWPVVPNLLMMALTLSGAAALLISEATITRVYTAIVGLVVAWDLSLFFGRLHSGASVVAETELIAVHLRRLVVLALLSTLGFAGYSFIGLNFHFERTLLLSVLLILSTALLVRRLQRKSN